MMNKLFFITLLCFISCQPSDEDLKINVSNTIRVSVSGLNINKVPINARIAAIPNDQTEITFFRPFVTDEGLQYSVEVNVSPIPENVFNVTFQIPSSYNNSTYTSTWDGNIIYAYTNLGRGIPTDALFRDADPFRILIGNLPIYNGFINLQDSIDEYNLEMSSLCYELYCESILHSDVALINVTYYGYYRSGTYFTGDLGDVTDDESLEGILTLTEQNGKYVSDTLIALPYFIDITKIEYIKSDTVLKTINTQFHLDTQSGMRYKINIPEYTNTNARLETNSEISFLETLR